MNGRLPALLALSLCALTLKGAEEKSAGNALLQFHDGSMLHGHLQQIDPGRGLTWAHPAAPNPLLFLPTNISNIRFEQVQTAPPKFTPTCRFYMRNGDELVGNLISFQSDVAELETSFAGNLKTTGKNIEAVVFSAKGYRLLYEGPNGLDGWKIGRNPRSWEYRDGSFIANGADLLGRDFGLNSSSSLEFDLSWSGSFSLSITLYAQAIDRFDYSTSAYLVYLGTGAVSIQRVQAGAGASMLGQAQIPEMLRKNKMRFEIRCNKEDASISLYADGQLVQRWKDNLGFAPRGSGIVFFSQVEPRALRLSNIRVAEWEGRYEPDVNANVPSTNDVVFLANKDRVTGEFVGVAGDKISVKTRSGTLDIPMARVTQIRFAEQPESKTAEVPWEVRASFPGGESIGFQLEKWTAEQVVGKSDIFGPVQFKPETIRQLVFGAEGLDSSQPDPRKEEDFPEFE